MVLFLKENVFITSPVASENQLNEEISVENFLSDIRPYIQKQI